MRAYSRYSARASQRKTNHHTCHSERSEESKITLFRGRSAWILRCAQDDGMGVIPAHLQM
jgi:hypothetical protein